MSYIIQRSVHEFCDSECITLNSLHIDRHKSGGGGGNVAFQKEALFESGVSEFVKVAGM